MSPDAAAICAIYNHYVLATAITFDVGYWQLNLGR